MDSIRPISYVASYPIRVTRKGLQWSLQVWLGFRKLLDLFELLNCKDGKHVETLRCFKPTAVSPAPYSCLTYLELKAGVNIGAMKCALAGTHNSTTFMCSAVHVFQKECEADLKNCGARVLEFELALSLDSGFRT